MLPEVYIENLSQYVGKEVKIYGWVYNKRSSGKIRFVLVRDGTGILQCVMAKGETPDEVFDKYDVLTQETSLIVSGIVNEDKRAPGGYELHIKDIQVIHIAQDYPITPKEHGIDFLMDHRHLWLRSRRPHAVLKIRHRLVKAIRDFFDSRGFVLIDAPILTPASCEGTTTLFETDYFDLGKAYLSQSGQLYVEAAAMAFGKVYCFGPTFRAEKSKTRRHLTEFWMVEPEVAFYELEEIMNLAEEFVEYIVARVLETSKREFEVLERNTEPLEKIIRPFPRISYNDAVEILKKNGINFQWGNDFGNTDETVISQQFEKPVIVHRYPAAVKAFYMKRDPQDETYALSFDMLAPEGYGEIIGGSQREDDYETLLKRIKEHNLPIDAFDWYLDLRKYGSVPHSGFGLGVERTLAWICGLDHVRETIPFPRMIYRIKP